MASHMQPPRSKARPFGILAVALGVGLLVLVVFDRNGNDDDAARVRDEAEQTTDPTVLGEVVERSTTLPAAPPASPATFASLADPSSSGDGGSTDTADPPQPPGTTSPTLLPPVSITSPNPPRTTTTTAPTTTTTEGTTTTEPTTTTTEPPADG